MDSLERTISRSPRQASAPIQHITKKSSSIPWLISEIKNLLFDRDNKKRKAMITKLNADWDEYKASRNKVNIALRQAKADYYRNKIATQNNNPKEAWKTINGLLGRSFRDTSVNELKINDANLTSFDEIAKAFNSYFSNVGPILANFMADSNVSFE